MRRVVSESLRDISINKTMSAPFGGWNALDDEEELQENEASIMDNFFPERGRVKMRNGYQGHLTGLGSSPKSILVYNSPNAASSKMFSCVNGNIYDSTVSATVAPTPAVSGLISDEWEYTQFGTLGGQFLCAASGSDHPRIYDGSTWSNMSVTGTGLTPSDISNINKFKERLFFIEKESFNAWYLPVNSIAGTASKLNLGSLFGHGGYLVAQFGWTIDGGSGVDDICCFLTSKGEIALYQGTDPSNASTWSKVGVFKVAPPIGKRCWFKIGSDVVLITEDGIELLSQILGTNRTAPQLALSNKIDPAFQDSANSYGDLFGWEPILYPGGKMGIFNIPIQADKTFHQYVFNLTTKKWCRFKGINARCFAIFNKKCYFGGDDGVYLFDSGQSDNGAEISAEFKTSYSYFKYPGDEKNFLMVMPVISANGNIEMGIKLNVDFENTRPPSTFTFKGASGRGWDVSWPSFKWSTGDAARNEWVSVNGSGYAGSLYVTARSKAVTASFRRWGCLFEVAN